MTQMIPVSSQLWELAGRAKEHAPLLRQAYVVLTVRDYQVKQFLTHAQALGYSGSTIEGALTFLHNLANQ